MYWIVLGFYLFHIIYRDIKYNEMPIHEKFGDWLFIKADNLLEGERKCQMNN